MPAETRSWKARYTVLLTVMLGMALSSIDRIAMSVTVPYIAADMHFSATAMGAVMSAFFISYGFSQIPGGLLAERFGVRRVATIAMVWWSIFTGLTGATRTLLQLAVARLVFGLGEGLFPPCCFATIANWFPRKERATANAFMFAAILLGGALSPLLVVAVLAQWGWRFVFCSLFGPGVLMAMLFWVAVPNMPAHSKRITSSELKEIEDDRASEGQPLSVRGSLLRILTSPDVMKYFLIYFAFDLAYWGFTTWLPSYLVNARGFAMVKMGMITSLPSFAGAAGCLLGGWVTDRYFQKNRRLPIIVTQLAAAAFLYLTFMAGSTTSLIIYQVFGGFFLMAFFGVFWALPMNTVATSQLGVVGGLINMSGQIAAFIAPVLIGVLVDISHGGFGLTFGFMIACLLASSALVLTVRTRPLPQAGEIPAQ